MPSIKLHEDGSLTLSPGNEAEARQFRTLARAALERADAINAGLLDVDLTVTFRPSERSKREGLAKLGPLPPGGRMLEFGTRVTAKGG